MKDIEKKNKFSEDNITKGSLKVSSYIGPSSNSNTYPTHKDIWGKGGYRSVYSLEDRDSIPEDRRKLGMLVYVFQNKTIYSLIDGLDNDNWEVLSFKQNLEYDRIFVGDEESNTWQSPVLMEVSLDILYVKEKLQLLRNKIYSHLYGLHEEQKKLKSTENFILPVLDREAFDYQAKENSMKDNTMWLA